MSSGIARVIVCENGSKWAVALRRRLRRNPRVVMCETRSLEDCWHEATVSPCSLIVLEVTGSNVERVAATLPKYRAKLPRVRAVVVGQRRLAPTEWLLRECGAVHVLYSPREVNRLVRIIQRHLNRVLMEQPGDAVAPWRDLPWARASDTVAEELPIHEPDWLLTRPESL